MHIQNLKLRNFRNYDLLNINFNEQCNIIYGNNAQGKTNIIEAIFFCAFGKSHRTSKDIDLIKVGTDGFYIRLNYIKDNIERTIEIKYDGEKRKSLRINDIPVKKLAELIGNLNAVIFSPEDLSIVKQGPSERRRFIDMALSQIKPSYFFDLQQYIKVLTQRNALLKTMQANRNALNTLDVWNENLAQIGSKIIKNRFEFTKRLSKSVEINHSRLTNAAEILHIDYNSSVRAEKYNDLLSIQEGFVQWFVKNRQREIAAGSTLIGPQRDDFNITLNGMELKLFGSQGQHRTAILALKLSEIDILYEEYGEHPILLLDDVMSELDHERQKFLMESINGIQTFITTTEKESLQESSLKTPAYFIVQKGYVAAG